jgi:hypothetical protein
VKYINLLSSTTERNYEGLQNNKYLNYYRPQLTEWLMIHHPETFHSETFTEIEGAFADSFKISGPHVKE